MYKFCVAFLLCLTSQIVNAQAFQAQKPVFCNTTKNMIDYLTERWKEKPMWVSKDSENDSRYVLMVNEETKTWSMIQMTDNVACVIGLGTDSTFILGKKV